MKKLFYSLMALTSVCYMTSCTTDQPVVDNVVDTEFHVVTYDVAGQAKNNLKVSTPIGNSGVKSLLYLVYNADGNLVKKRTWTKGQDITQIKDTLASGTYKVVFFGTSVQDNDVNMDPSSQYSYATFREGAQATDTSYFYLKQAVNADMFYKKAALQVGKSDVKQTVELSRIVSQVEVLISDAATVPADVASIRLALAPKHPTVFMLQNEQTVFTEGTTATDYFLPVMPEMTRSQFLTNTTGNKPLTFTMLATDPVHNKANVGTNLCFIIKRTSGQEQVVYIKENVSVKPNIPMQYSGNLFDKFDVTAGIGEINVQDQWGAKEIETIK